MERAIATVFVALACVTLSIPAMGDESKPPTPDETKNAILPVPELRADEDFVFEGGVFDKQRVSDLLGLIKDKKGRYTEALFAIADLRPVPGPVVPILVGIMLDTGQLPRDRNDCRYALTLCGGAARAALPALELLLRDKELSIRVSAACTVARMRQVAAALIPKAVAVAREGLGGEEGTQLLALMALAFLGRHSEAALPELLKAAESESNEAVQAVVSQLVRIAAPKDQVVPVLKKLFASRKAATKACAAWGLASVGAADEHVVEFLTTPEDEKLTESQEFRTRGLVCIVRDQSPLPKPVADLIADPKRNRDLGLRLSQAGLHGALQLIRLIPDETNGSALSLSEVCYQLAVLGPNAEPALDALLAMLEHGTRNKSDLESLTQAIGAMGLKAERALPALWASLKSRSEPVHWDARVAVLKAIAAIAPKDAKLLEILRGALKGDDDGRFQLIEIYAQVGGEAAEIIAAIEPALNQKLDNDARWSDLSPIFEVLGAKAKPLLPVLRRLLGTHTNRADYCICTAIAAMGDAGREAEPELRAFLVMPQRRAKADAVFALGVVGKPGTDNLKCTRAVWNAERPMDRRINLDLALACVLAEHLLGQDQGDALSRLTPFILTYRRGENMSDYIPNPQMIRVLFATMAKLGGEYKACLADCLADPDSPLNVQAKAALDANK